MMLRLTHCPRCATKAEKTRPFSRPVPKETIGMVMSPNKSAALSDSETFEEEELIKYLPCGCLINKKHHEDIVRQNDNLL